MYEQHADALLTLKQQVIKAQERYRKWPAMSQRIEEDFRSFAAEMHHFFVLTVTAGGEGMNRTVQIDMPSDTYVNYKGERAEEYGAFLIVSQRHSGMVNFTYVSAEKPGQSGQPRAEKVLATVEPSDAFNQVDDMLLKLVKNALSEHWSKVP